MKLAVVFSSLISLATFYVADGFVGPATRTTTTLKNAVVDSENSAAATSPDTMTLFSPCKINLFLRIVRKREDGYHDLASLFQAVGFGDTLELTPLEDEAESDDFTCNMAGVPVDDTNLVLRALELMRQKTGVSKYFQTNLIKQVPAQAGLGGGSANAATAMWGANELMGKPASLEEVSFVPSSFRAFNLVAK
jgi:4-diphosphocytidyl-2-C-methyl-D-erythritol kinase